MEMWQDSRRMYGPPQTAGAAAFPATGGAMKYYKVSYDESDPEWKKFRLLSLASTREGAPCEDWAYSDCQCFESDHTPLVKVSRRGVPRKVDREGYSILLVVAEVARRIEAVAGSDVQLLKCVGCDEPSVELVNILTSVDCLDREKSVVECRDPYNKRYFECKRGQIASIWRLVIDPAKADGHHLFRLHEYEVTAILSEVVVKALVEAEATRGLAFYEVATECALPGRIEYFCNDKRKMVPWSYEARRAFLDAREKPRTE